MTTETATETERRMASTGKGLRWFVDSMWGFWLLLLAISMGLAAIIYWVWLKGTI